MELRCPICRRGFDPAASKALPFCSPRCKQVDLGRWLDEKYGLPAETGEQAAGERSAEGLEPDRRGS